MGREEIRSPLKTPVGETMRKPTTADPPYLPFPFNFALRKPRPDVCGPGKRKGAQLAHILPVWVVLVVLVVLRS